MIIFIKNKYTLQLDEFKFNVVLEKKVLQLIKKKGIKRHLKEYLKLKIFISEEIG